MNCNNGELWQQRRNFFLEHHSKEGTGDPILVIQMWGSILVSIGSDIHPIGCWSKYEQAPTWSDNIHYKNLGNFGRQKTAENSNALQ
jgi:hypothetical protein